MEKVGSLMHRTQLLFRQEVNRFYIHQSLDAPLVRSLKLQILILLADKQSIGSILPELIVSRKSDRQVMRIDRFA